MDAKIIVPLVSAALAAIVSLVLNYLSRKATQQDVVVRIDAEREITNTKIAHEKDGAFGQRAWTDYGLRRDIYLELATTIGVLFEHNSVRLSFTPDTHMQERDRFFAASRKARLIGSDEVVRALNQLTSGIRLSAGSDVHAANYAHLMNMIRRDIRTLNTNPAMGTDLDETAFPLEG